jgi:hypothetical protein
MMAEKILNLAFQDLSNLPENLAGYTGIELDGNKFTEE